MAKQVRQTVQILEGIASGERAIRDGRIFTDEEAREQMVKWFETEVDSAWASVASKRLSELRSGKVKSVSGPKVFAKIRKRFEE